MSAELTRDGWGQVSTARGRISFLARGAGRAKTPLVLLPSLGGGAGHWGKFGEKLAAERRTIALDPPGFGHSSAPPIWLSTRVLAEQLLAALDALGVVSFALFGCSLGALLATRLALLAPERVEALLLASAAVRGRDFVPLRAQRAFRLLRDIVVNRHPKRSIARDIAHGTIPSTDEPPPPVAGASWSRARLLHYAGAAFSHDASKELKRLTMPVLVLYGEQDGLLGTTTQQRLREGLAHADFRVFRGAGHDLVNEAPEDCAQAVLRFLR